MSMTLSIFLMVSLFTQPAGIFSFLAMFVASLPFLFDGGISLVSLQQRRAI